MQIDGVTVYTAREAAEYCGLKIDAFRYHIKRGHVGFKSKIGASCLFTRQQLDRFKAETTFKPRRTRQARRKATTEVAK